MRMHRARFLLAPAVAFVLLACGGTTTGGAARLDSGIRGTVTIGPTCPVQRVPPDPQCGDQPYDAAIRIYRRSTGKLVARTTSGSDGKFTVRLAPARYRVRARNRTGSAMPHPAEQDTTVHAHRFTRVHITMDSGIR